MKWRLCYLYIARCNHCVAWCRFIHQQVHRGGRQVIMVLECLHEVGEVATLIFSCEASHHDCSREVGSCCRDICRPCHQGSQLQPSRSLHRYGSCAWVSSFFV